MEAHEVGIRDGVFAAVIWGSLSEFGCDFAATGVRFLCLIIIYNCDYFTCFLLILLRYTM